MVLRWCILLLVLLLPGCFLGESIPLGAPFDLPLGKRVLLRGEDLSITFQEVLEDSRCPLGVTCFWEGRVVFTVVVEEQGEEGHFTVTLHPTDFPHAEYWKAYRFTFLDFGPEREVGVEIPLHAYRLTVMVER
ncbi:MAG: hypothetical protein ACP5Q4_02530, partial [Candidatus Caldatribacteriaceae bacterium]